ncbi:hypothetical protein [Pantoea conspicua]|nr:hypothetical protein [Pantoea conspicua]
MDQLLFIPHIDGYYNPSHHNNEWPKNSTKKEKMMKELNQYEIKCVSGAGWQEVFEGAIIGATTYAFIGGKWAMASGITTFGVAQLVGTVMGIAIGGIGGALYGITHTSEQVENFFNNVMDYAG